MIRGAYTARGRLVACVIAAVAACASVCGAVQNAEDIGLKSAGDAWQFYRVARPDPSLPKVLLIGDSITNGYRNTVIQKLAGEANVDTWLTPLHLKSKTLHADLNKVLEQGPYAVVHFNIGLHGWTPGRIPEGEYEPALRAYVDVIKSHAGEAKLIWGSTTQITVKDKPAELDPEHNPTIVERNKIAARVMPEMKVAVDDLYGLMSDKLQLARGDKYHWQKEGCKLQGEQVARFVKKALGIDPSENGEQ
jgi:hypothetical protein